MEGVNKNDVDAIDYGPARNIFGQSSPHLREVLFDGVLAVLYPGLPHVFIIHIFVYILSTISFKMHLISLCIISTHKLYVLFDLRLSNLHKLVFPYWRKRLFYCLQWFAITIKLVMSGRQKNGICIEQNRNIEYLIYISALPYLFSTCDLIKSRSVIL